jgi:hypothetical protein
MLVDNSSNKPTKYTHTHTHTHIYIYLYNNTFTTLLLKMVYGTAKDVGGIW